MKRLPLLKIFESALSLSPLLLSGCAIDLQGLEAPVCENNRLSVSGLTPAVIPDAIELRSTLQGDVPRVHSRTGTPCVGAADRPACETAFAALSSEEGFHYGGDFIRDAYYLAVSSGDQVRMITSTEALRSFLGTIDTAQEAVLLTFAGNVEVTCGKPAVRVSEEGGFEVVAESGFACGANTARLRHLFRIAPDGTRTELQQEVLARGMPGCVIGRRPVGLREQRLTAGCGALGQHFASAAQLEAASVPAFLRLAAELKLHGAGRALRRRALNSAQDEVRHARTTAALAHRFGGVASAPQIDDAPLRSLIEVAMENAAEGCVRETFGALVGHHQAAAARDRHIRRAMEVIARDETRHAELAWDVARWAERKLSAGERAQVREKRAEAIETLRRELREPVAPELVEAAGWPTPQAAEAMVESMDAQLWRAA
jgi:hypothetical protein